MKKSKMVCKQVEHSKTKAWQIERPGRRKHLEESTE